MLRVSPLGIQSLSRCPIGQGSCAVVQGKLEAELIISVWWP
jgi:hypothetical protein